MPHQKSEPVKTCPVRGCNVALEKRMLMCRGHWGLVSAPLKADVWRWYGNGSGVTNPMYQAAATKAIAFVDEKEAVAADQAKQQFLL